MTQGRKLTAVAIAAAAIAAWSPSAASAGGCGVNDALGLSNALANASCDPVVLAPGDYLGKFTINRAVTVRGSGGPSVTTVTADAGAGSVFTTTGTGAVAFEGLTIRGASSGAGINSQTTLSVDDSVITNNSFSGLGGEGAGIRWIGASPETLTVTDSVISLNTSTGFTGGGVHAVGTGTASFNRVHFDQNKSLFTTFAGGGGGISTAGITATIANSTFTGNRTNADGGAVRTEGPLLQLNNITAVGNVADDNADNMGSGGGVALEQGTMTFANSIIANNEGIMGAADDCFLGAFGAHSATRLGYNLIRAPGNCAFENSVTPPLTDDPTGYITGVDPLLGPPSAPGLKPPLPGSPAIDAGNPAVPGSGGAACDAVDELGTARGTAANARCDLGAIEVGTVPAGGTVPPVFTPILSGPISASKKCKKGRKRKKGKCVRKKKKRKK